MSRIKIEEPGWHAFTGALGSIEFVDGVSVEPVSTRDAHRIGGSMRVSYVDGNDAGKQASVTAREVELRHLDAELAAANQPEAPIEPPIVNPEPEPAPPVQAAASDDGVFTREELEKIADDSGIRGLRLIGDRFGVKNTSIAGLIAEILDAQAKAAAAPAPAPQV